MVEEGVGEVPGLYVPPHVGLGVMSKVVANAAGWFPLNGCDEVAEILW